MRIRCSERYGAGGVSVPKDVRAGTAVECLRVICSAGGGEIDEEGRACLPVYWDGTVEGGEAEDCGRGWDRGGGVGEEGEW